MYIIIPHRPKCEFCGEYIDLWPEYCPRCGRLVPQRYDKKAMEEGTRISLIIAAVCILIALWVVF